MRIRGSIALSGYQITEQLYAGSRTLVYRALREADQQSVVIKLLKNEHPNASELVQFRNQYAITKQLEMPGIIQPYGLEPYRNGYALVMEDFGGTSLRHFTQGQPLTLEAFFAIALQITNILHELHQQRIIHKDIKPANILIQPETQQIKLIDFSIASLLPRETQAMRNPNGLEGTLAYLSPEQTGRMNRGIDYRSDFYSLGVTFFELLVGQLPFQAPDPMALVHCHLAQQPPSICDRNPDLPLMLGEVIRKLMAKNAEDRYQSATGLKHDLMKCQAAWHIADTHTRFALGQCDVSDRFLIPEKLYGREQEVAALLASFERVAGDRGQGTGDRGQGAEDREFKTQNSKLSPLHPSTPPPHHPSRSELMLVSGFSGIGKTAVVNEVHKPIVQWHGYFIKGKYDQFQRNLPFSAFVQAFRNLIGQLLSESDEQLQQWQDSILSALGENAQVLIEMMPELEQVIGNQPPAPALSGSAAQNRFHLLFQTFIAVFAARSHPLVLFLDDLQWADSASLNLLQVLLSQREAGYLFIIGAYRDNEVFPAHPLMLTLSEIAKANATLNTLTLNPLSQADINDLVAETLHCSLDLAQPLTALVYQKTQGNPFFTTQFLKSLHEEGYIVFEPQVGHWQCDLAAVRSLSITDDVVEFMALQLQKLPVATQNVLKFAACIGAQFDLETLAIVVQQSQTEVATALWKALQEGLVLPRSDVYKFYQAEDASLKTQNLELNIQNCSYRFLHDRVQQAAYSLILDQQKQATHLAIGQLLLQNTPKAAQGENLFEIVNQFNMGRTLISDRALKTELAELNLKAGHKARTGTAHAAALAYCVTGIGLLAEDQWQNHYELTLALYEAATEAAYLSGEFEQMEAFMVMILAQARTLLDTVKVYELQIQAALAQNQPLEAVQIALKLLKLLEITFPEQPTERDSAQALAATAALLAGRKPLDLMTLPQMSNAHTLAAMRILAAVTPCAYVSAPALVPLLILEQVKRSIQAGNAPSSAFGYACYSLLLCGIVGEIDTGHQFGQLALHLFDQFDVKALKAKTHGQVYGLVWHWKEPVRSTLIPLREAYQSGLETGDLTWASIAACLYAIHAYFGGNALNDLSGELSALHTQLAQIKQEALLSQLRIFQQSLLNLLNQTEQPQALTGDVFNVEQMLPVLEQSNDRIALCYFYVAKLFLSYLFDDLEAAIAAAIANEAYIGAATGLFVVPVFSTYDSLAHLAFYAQVAEAEQHKALERVTANQKKLKKWADHAPMNHLHKFHLVEAERCRVLGQKVEAIDHYDRAITLAKANNYIQENALANELAAKFYLEWGKERIAQEYMTEAYYSYARWGAKAKIADLERRYPALLAPLLQQSHAALSVNETVFATESVTASSSSSSASDSLDLATILKISQTLSSAIELDQLISVLLHAVIQSAGADKCVLMLLEDKRLMVQATATITAFNQVEVQVHTSPQPTQTSPEIPLSLINSVKRHLQSAVILDATIDPQFVADGYIQTHQPKSILCSPILHQGKLIGILYLENNLATGAFTSDRLEFLNLLCAQAAISLENVRLYGREQEKSRSLQVSLEQLKQTEVTLFQEREFLNAIIHTITDGIVVCDANGKLTLFNQATREFHGLPVESLPAEQWAEHFSLYQPDGQTPLAITEIPLFRALQGEIVENAEMVIAPKHGSRRILLASGQAIFDPWGNKVGAVVVMRDISDRKRTEQALQQKTQALEDAVSDLQSAQIQIVQSEKMSALGNLVAGVAHEINNPVGFIAGNLQPAIDYVNDTFGLIDLYQQEYPHPSAAIQAEIDAIDLDYVREDLPKLIASMQLGVDRIRSISTSLRTFSRADKEYKVPFNIHEGIDSTLLILKHRLKANETRPEIEVVIQYGNIPTIECFPGQLNQVFMNILANAIDALEEKSAHDSLEANAVASPSITIRTDLVNAEQVIIQISDNGSGIPPHVQQRLFDLFFTTKPVGKGTGMGLSISHQIVAEKHNGTLYCTSEPQQGTTFSITLPIRSA